MGKDFSESMGNYISEWVGTIKSESMGTFTRNQQSTFQEISKSSFRPLPVIMPSPAVHEAFDRQIRPLYERIVANERESKTLAATRDLLLPKLMSGEIRVQDAEEALVVVA
jgi:type I restriction enzyme S subunit